MISILGVSALKGLGSVLGLVITMAIATLFGASATVDAFFLARRVTSNLAVALERAFHLLQVPALVQLARNKGLDALRERLLARARWVLIASLLATALGMALAGPIIRTLAPGFDAGQVLEAALYFRIMLLGLPISAVTALSGAVLNALQLYSLPVMARLAPRLAVLLALALIPVGFGIGALAVATLLGTIAMGMVFGITGRRVLASGQPLPVPAAPAAQIVPAVSAVSAPAAAMPAVAGRGRIIAMLVAQFHVIAAGWIDLGFASTTGAGRVAIYDFAIRMVNMTPGLVTNSVVLVYYTHFAMALADRDRAAFRGLVGDSIRATLFFVLPVAVALFLLGEPVVRTFLQHGRFGAEDAALTARILTILALLVPVNAVLGSLSSAIFADEQMPQLAMIGGSILLALAIRIGFDLVMVPRIGLVAVPLGSLLSMLGILVVLWIWLSRHGGALVQRHEARPFAALALAAALAGLAIWLMREAVLTGGDASRLRMLVAIGASLAAGGTVYLLVTVLAGLPETAALRRRLAGRAGRRPGA